MAKMVAGGLTEKVVTEKVGKYLCLLGFFFFFWGGVPIQIAISSSFIYFNGFREMVSESFPFRTFFLFRNPSAYLFFISFSVVFWLFCCTDQLVTNLRTYS